MPSRTMERNDHHLSNDILVTKIGGGVITIKENYCHANHKMIDEFAFAIAMLIKRKQYKHIVIVHGAGSFGHLKAKAWQIHKGKILNFKASGETYGLHSQEDAVKAVQHDMNTLNQLFVNALVRQGLRVNTHPSSIWARGTGHHFHGDILNRFCMDSVDVDVTCGDAVWCDGPEGFGILSGDDIITRLALELPHIRKVIFVVQGVDGLLFEPPCEVKPQQVIPTWSGDYDVFHGLHDSDIDVTGGIFLKLACALEISNHHIDVYFVRDDPDRFVDLCCDMHTICTRIPAK